jgi:hypothetical protein
MNRYQRLTLENAWTGLGTATDYKKAVDAGLMKTLHGPNPGYQCWFGLTAEGAKLVQVMIDRDDEPPA